LQACDAMPSSVPHCKPAMQRLRPFPIASLRCNAFVRSPLQACDATPSSVPHCKPAMQCLRPFPIASLRCNAFVRSPLQACDAMPSSVPLPPSSGCSKASMARRRKYRHRRRTGKYGEDAGTCGNNARRRFSTAGLALQDVVFYIPVLHIRFVAFIAQSFINAVGNKNRAMQAACAADGNNQLALTFFYIIGH